MFVPLQGNYTTRNLPWEWFDQKDLRVVKQDDKSDPMYTVCGLCILSVRHV